jgi:hypothetical protein
MEKPLHPMDTAAVDGYRCLLVNGYWGNGRLAGKGNWYALSLVQHVLCLIDQTNQFIRNWFWSDLKFFFQANSINISPLFLINLIELVSPN